MRKFFQKKFFHFAVFAAPVCVGAFLLFQVQPMIGKFILPWFGGSSATWTVSMLFFQALLVLGYGYAHLMTKYLPPTRQLFVHGVLLICAIVALPIVPGSAWKPAPDADPVLSILLLLAVSIGLPFFMLASASPLLQSWFWRSHPNSSPYPLYALSNAGSFFGLLSYPILFEPYFKISQQAQIWSAGFIAFAVLVMFSGLRARRSSLPATAEAKSDTTFSVSAHSGFSGQKMLWAALPMLSTTLLLSVTGQLTQNVAPFPFLWVFPLGIYLLTYVIAFSGAKGYSRGIWTALFIVSLAPFLFLELGHTADIPSQMFVYSFVLFAGCMICHGELALRKPDPASLAQYYFMISLGGALGGMFAAVAAPALFHTYLEMNLAVFAIGALLLSTIFFSVARKRWADWARIAALGICLVVAAPVMYFNENGQLSGMLTVKRNFYGTFKVAESGGENPEEHMRFLSSGIITHGLQFLSPEKRTIPTSYFSTESGVGRLLRSVRARGNLRVGVLGLGVGTLAAYAEPQDTYIFYEINPEIITAAHRDFFYLADARGRVETVLGDARLSLEREEPQNFDVLVVDVFNGDAIPTHLLTREAMEIYLKHLRPDGALAFHISNSYLDFFPVLSALADHFGLRVELIIDAEPNRPIAMKSIWAIVSENREIFDDDLIARAIAPPRKNANIVPLWTDDFSNPLRIVRPQGETF